MQIDKVLAEALAVAGRLKSAGDRVNRAAVAKGLGISRAAASDRLRRLYALGLLPRGPASGRIGVEDAVAAARLDAVRRAARGKGQALTSEELDGVLGD